MPRVDGETNPDIEVNCTMRSRHSASSSTSHLLLLFSQLQWQWLNG